ncbi:hypothetical protein C0Q70_12256 [Pomacea canaliculata]|uniref:Ig-like domain-containing protein n=1 Tax=Pomacea canaliculata TaxID=400727 RepID=A0A2T7P115_POMCA|nr:hypothetical protein C0Q70_12256 [Pomacea canaliculata]
MPTPTLSCNQAYIPEEGPASCICNSTLLRHPEARLRWVLREQSVVSGDYGVGWLPLPPEVVNRTHDGKNLVCEVEWFYNRRTELRMLVAYGPDHVTIRPYRVVYGKDTINKTLLAAYPVTSGQAYLPPDDTSEVTLVCEMTIGTYYPFIPMIIRLFTLDRIYEKPSPNPRLSHTYEMARAGHDPSTPESLTISSNNEVEELSVNQRSVSCEQLFPNSMVYWSITPLHGQVKQVGMCEGATCTSAYRPNVYPERFHPENSSLVFLNVTREWAGTVVCTESFTNGSEQSVNSTLDVYYNSGITNIRVGVNREDWTLNTSFIVTKIFSALGNYGAEFYCHSKLEEPSTPEADCHLDYVPEEGPSDCICASKFLGSPEGRLRWYLGGELVASGDYGVRRLPLPSDIVNRTHDFNYLECEVEWLYTERSELTIQVAYGPDDVIIKPLTITHLEDGKLHAASPVINGQDVFLPPDDTSEHITKSQSRPKTLYKTT